MERYAAYGIIDTPAKYPRRRDSKSGIVMSGNRSSN